MSELFLRIKLDDCEPFEVKCSFEGCDGKGQLADGYEKHSMCLEGGNDFECRYCKGTGKYMVRLICDIEVESIECSFTFHYRVKEYPRYWGHLGSNYGLASKLIQDYRNNTLPPELRDRFKEVVEKESL